MVRRSFRALGLAQTTAWLLLATLANPAAADVAETLRSLERSAAGGRLRSVVSPHTGAVTFLRTTGTGIPLPASAAATAADRARTFLRSYGPSLKLPGADETVVAASSPPDEAGFEHVRLHQEFRGIPVRYGEMTLHLRGDRLTAFHGKTVTDLAGIDLSPNVTASDAAAIAASVVRNEYDTAGATFSDPGLELFNRGLIEGTGGTTRLAWFVAAAGPMLNAQVWIDAQTGAVLFHLNQVPDALNRVIYDMNYVISTPYPGALVGSEGSPPSTPQDAVDVFAYTEDTYNYYLTEHGRDSFDGFGATMQSTVRYCDGSCGCPCFNAFWNGAHTVFGLPPFSMDDVVGHEWTHGVTQYTGGLIYYKASGALNESFSDIFGEVIDLTNTGGYDVPEVRWRVGEFVGGPTGIRDMMTPGNAPGFDPDKVSSFRFYCGEADSGGVHTNSAIGNHAFALMVDGGSFNGYTIVGIGLTKAGKIEYRALTEYLTPTSSFRDNYEALLQSCSDLLGIAGLTAADCVEVQKALDSVEMFGAWPCTCGDGFLDPGEDCDDGNQTDGDCCSSLCRAATLGDPCSDSDGCTSGDTCQMAGPTLACIGTDGPRNDCKGSVDVGTARITIKNTVNNDRDTLSYSYGKGLETFKSEFGDPVNGGTDFSFCLYKDTQSAPVYKAFLQGGTKCRKGRPCWKETRKGFRYSDSGALRSGVKALTLAEGLPGRTRIRLRAKGSNLAPPDVNTLNANLTAQVISSAGACWDAEFATPPTKLSTEVFKDKGE